MRGIIAGSPTALALCGPAFAGPITDTSRADRSISVDGGNSSNIPSPAGAGTTFGTRSSFAREERNHFGGDGAYAGLNGGQNYDVDLVTGPSVGPRRYVANVTGQRPDYAAGLPGFRFVRRRS